MIWFSVFLGVRMSPRDRTTSTGTRSTESISSLSSALPPNCSFPSPDKRGGLLVPSVDCSLQPSDDLLGCLWMTAGQSSGLEDALNGFGHIQPGASYRGIEQSNPVCEAPEHKISGLMSGQVIQHQQQTQRGKLLGEGGRHRQAFIPRHPHVSNGGRVEV